MTSLSTASLSTHVLDTMHGRPAANVTLELQDGAESPLFAGRTDADGRCPGLPRLTQGRYTLVFAIAAYFRDLGVDLSEPPFLDRIAISFGIADVGHYHVPLLCSPYSYSTYRGS